MGGITKSIKKIAKVVFPVHTIADKFVKTGKNLLTGLDAGADDVLASGSTVIAPDAQLGETKEEEEDVTLGSGRSKQRKGRQSGRRTLMAPSGGSSAGSSGLKV